MEAVEEFRGRRELRLFLVRRMASLEENVGVYGEAYDGAYEGVCWLAIPE